MKFIVVAVLLCLSFYFASSMHVTTYGNVTSNMVGTQSVLRKALQGEAQSVDLMFTHVSCVLLFFHFSLFLMNLSSFNMKFGWFKMSKIFCSFLQIPKIVGIKHVDLEDQPSLVTFTNGGIGEENVNIHVQSERNFGINSVFYFYGWDHTFVWFSLRSVFNQDKNFWLSKKM